MVELRPLLCSLRLVFTASDTGSFINWNIAFLSKGCYLGVNWAKLFKGIFSRVYTLTVKLYDRWLYTPLPL